MITTETNGLAQVTENDEMVQAIFDAGNTPFDTVEELFDDLLAEMQWDVNEGTVTFTPITVDDITNCSGDAPTVDAGCENEVASKQEAVTNAR